MRLRTAIKIQLVYEEPIKSNGRLRRKGIKWPYNARQYKESQRICRRHWRDRRVPYIPSDEELIDRAEIQGCILADVFIEDERERDAVKERILLAGDECRTAIH